MELSIFEQVLQNPLWKKKTSPIDPEKVVYHFQVSQEATVLYTVDAENQVVAATSLPKDLKDFRPNVLNWGIAWRKWFAPWCFNEDVLKLLESLQGTPMNWVCNTQNLTINFNYMLADEYFSYTIELTPKGKVLRAKTEYQDLFPAPREDDAPRVRYASIQEIQAEVDEAIEAYAKMFAVKE